MDRERLKEVHQTDLTESNINEDFVEWLKTKGPSWLLTVLVCIIVYVVIIRFKEHQASRENEGWYEFQQCSLPGQYEDVAADFADLEGLALLARLQAAEQRLAIVLRGFELDSGMVTGGEEGQEPPQPQMKPLTAEERERLLTLADQLYQDILQSDDQTPAKTLYIVNAMTGRAAVAEARGQLDEASNWWEQAAKRAEAYDADLAGQFRKRLGTLELDTAVYELPTQAEIRTLQAGLPRPTPLRFEEAFRDLLLKSPLDGE